jgi:hypothetical protein
MRGPDRRTVLAAAAALGAAATAPGLARAAGATLTLYDPREPAAVAFARARSGKRAAIQGDRIRLARRLLGDGAPARLTLVGRHADLILLTEAAREAGYRALALRPLPAGDAGGLYVWAARRQA